MIDQRRRVYTRIIREYVALYKKHYGVEPNVKLRLSSRLMYYRGITYDWDSRVVVTFGTYLEEQNVRYIIIHELAHVLAGPRHNHDKAFYRALWRVVKAFGFDAELVENEEKRYKPRNSQTFAALRMRNNG